MLDVATLLFDADENMERDFLRIYRALLSKYGYEDTDTLMDYYSLCKVHSALCYSGSSRASGNLEESRRLIETAAQTFSRVGKRDLAELTLEVALQAV